jgi:glutathione S-transferase
VRRWDEQNLTELTRYHEALMARASISRVIDEARPFREFFPLPWPDYVA